MPARLYTWNNEYGRAPQLVSYVVIGSLSSVIPLVIVFLSRQRFWRSGPAAGSVTLRAIWSVEPC